MCAKTKASIRTVILPPDIVRILEKYKKRINSRRMFPSPVKEDSPRHPSSVRAALERTLERAECKHLRFHDLRHTFATNALAGGVDAKTLSGILGHFSAGFTLDTYKHITNDMQRGAAEKIGGFMESTTAATTPEPPDPPEESRCKAIPFERVG